VKRLAIAIAIAGIIGTPAFAADIATKAPAPAPAPVYNWTGWYVGVNAGASMGSAKTDFNVAPIFDHAIQITPGFGFSDTSSPAGFIGGGQIGYNWQYSPLIVVGFEADIQGALERDTRNQPSQSNFFFETSTAISESTVGPANYTTQIDWFGTVRARIGYVWGNGNVLSYVTGGLAYGEVKINGSTTLSAAFDSTIGGGAFSLTDTFGHSQVNTGWVLGYGTEGVIDFWGARNWTWKVETLYMDLGHLNATGPSSINCFECNEAVHLTGGQVNTNTHFTDWILRGGLNYKFY
jgi:outer membrane immunogenic protein